MIKLEEVLPKNHFNLRGYNSENNILIVGRARCGKSYLAEAIIKHKGGEFLLITDDWFEDKIKLISSQETQKISGINSSTKPVVTQLILPSNMVIFDDVGIFILRENSQDYLDLFRLAFENDNIITIVLAQSPNSKVLSKLFPEEKILFDKMLVGKFDYSYLSAPLVKNLSEIDSYCCNYFGSSSEKRYFMYYEKNKFQGIVSAN